MRWVRIVAIVSIACLAAWAQAVPAIDPATDWLALRGTPPGKCLLLTATDQREYKGRLVRWTEQQLVLSSGRSEQVTFPRAGIQQVGEFKSCSSMRAALMGGILGFSIGFGATAIGTQSLCVNCGPDETGLLGAVIVGAAVGAVSAFVAARSGEQRVRLLYRKP